jgi:signal transduction histidine kinase
MRKSKTAEHRHPVSRQLMLALFVLMIVPVCGWYFIGDLASHRLLSALPEASHSQLLEVQREIRFKLAINLGVSVLVLGGVILYVRRTILDPLERLAVQARRGDSQAWSTPQEAARPDEVGDLARALDSSVTRLVQRAEEAERFAANLSHELRTPLAAIRGAGEILGDPDLSPEDRHRFAGNVVCESQRLERLVSGLLVLARAERERSDEIQLLDMAEVIRQVSESNRPLASAKHLHVELGIEGETPPVRAAEDLVVRVLTVLIENAIEHASVGGAILLGLRSRASLVEVAVEDSGAGVPVEERERIFDRWYALRSESRQGTGLGLAIARSLVEGMGGQIWVDTSPLGGASFRFTLPAGIR